MEIPLSAISQSVQRGDILLSEFDGIDHRKFFVVMGVSKEKVCGFFFINSNIHPSILKKEELLALQYPLKHIEYPFLNYDSFLCASSVIERNIVMISKGIMEGSTKVIGKLRDQHVREVLEMVRASKVISKRHKLLYFQ